MVGKRHTIGSVRRRLPLSICNSDDKSVVITFNGKNDLSTLQNTDIGITSLYIGG